MNYSYAEDIFDKNSWNINEWVDDEYEFRSTNKRQTQAGMLKTDATASRAEQQSQRGNPHGFDQWNQDQYHQYSRDPQADTSTSFYSLESLLRECLSTRNAMFQSQIAANPDLEVYMIQIAEALENEKQGALLSTTKVPRGNLGEQCQGEALLSGKINPTVHYEGTQGNLQPLNASTSEPMESTMHIVQHPSSSTKSEDEENIKGREKATQVEPAFVYEDTTSGRVLIDVQEEISTPRAGDQVKFNVVNALNNPNDFQFCPMNADINENVRPVNVALRSEILKDGEDGENDDTAALRS